MAAVGRVTGSGARAGTVGRVTGAGAVAVTSTVGRVTDSGAAAVASTVGRVSGSGASALIDGTVSVPNLTNLEPGTRVTVTPGIDQLSPTAIVWSSDQPGLAFTQTAAGLLSYVAPASRDGVTIVWTCTVKRTGGADVTATGSHRVLLHAGPWMLSVAKNLYPVTVGLLT